MTSYTPMKIEAKDQVHPQLVELEKQLASLEGQVLNWDQLERDAKFNHQVGDEELREWDRVNAETRRFTQFRITICKLRRGFSVAQWPADVRKYVESYNERSGIWDRLEDLDDQIEVFEDVYELANDRLSEYSYFRREYKLEVLIAFLLFVEIAIMLGELFFLAK